MQYPIAGQQKRTEGDVPDAHWCGARTAPWLPHAFYQLSLERKRIEVWHSHGIVSSFLIITKA